MKMHFLASGDSLVRERHRDGSHYSVGNGQIVPYVGRMRVAVHVPPASEKPYECDSDTGEAVYLAKCCREGDLLPADEATAAACGVKWTPAIDHKPAPKSAKDGS